jgi:hypothetical protein
MAKRSLELLVVTCVALAMLETRADTPPRSVLIDGVYIKVLNKAFSEHVLMPDLTEQQKQIENYRIQFQEDTAAIVVVLIPKIPPGWRTFGGDSPYGRSALYTVDKKTMKITKRELFK